MQTPTFTDWINSFGTCLAALATTGALIVALWQVKQARVEANQARRDANQARQDAIEAREDAWRLRKDSLEPWLVLAGAVPAFESADRLQQISFKIINMGSGPALKVSVQFKHQSDCRLPDATKGLHGETIFLRPGEESLVVAQLNLNNPPEQFIVRLRCKTVFAETMFSGWGRFSVNYPTHGKTIPIDVHPEEMLVVEHVLGEE